MTWLLITLGFTLHSAQAVALYTQLKDSPYYYWVMLAAANITSFLWLYIASRQTRDVDILLYGTIWDIGLLSAYVLAPLLYAGVKLSPTAWCGLLLSVLGVIIFKIGA